MSEFIFSATPRDASGTSASRRLRHTDHVPGVLYGNGKQTQSLTFVHKDIARAFEDMRVFSSIVDVVVDGKKTEAIIKAIQRHPSKETILHIDFQSVSNTQPITALVPLQFIGEEQSEVLKLGGHLTKHLVSVEIRCLPKQLPTIIEVPVADMTLGETVHLSQLQLPTGVTIVALSHGDKSHDQTVCYLAKSRLNRMTDDDEEEITTENNEES